VDMAHYLSLLFVFFTLNLTTLFASEDRGIRDSNHVPIRTTRLVTDADHTRFLKDTLATATNQVMISTYNTSPNRLLGEGLGQAIIDASKRGVAVYVYYENRPWFSKEDFDDLETVASHCAKFEENANQSKCVIKDKSAVAIGSHNWLSDTRGSSSNGTMVITGRLASGPINDVWAGIRFYQSLEYGNEWGIEKFLNDRGAFSTGEHQFAPGQFLYTLQTPDAHGIFLNEVFEKTQSRVLLFSPFIRLAKLQGVFSFPLLYKLEQRGVNIKLITLPSPCDHVPREQKEIFSHLESLCVRYPNFSYVTHPNFHARTLLADWDLICEGSFNWLSAVTQFDHGANNFKMSIAIRGTIAHDMIQTFEETALGKFVVIRPVEVKTRAPLQQEPRIVSNVKQPASQQRKQFISRGELPIHKQPPLKKPKVTPEKIPQAFDNIIKVFSGEGFGVEGYCVRFNKSDYLRKGDRILYFETPESAKQAAYAVWKNKDSSVLLGK
jgi:hypothetical protein